MCRIELHGVLRGLLILAELPEDGRRPRPDPYQANSTGGNQKGCLALNRFLDKETFALKKNPSFSECLM